MEYAHRYGLWFGASFKVIVNKMNMQIHGEVKDKVVHDYLKKENIGQTVSFISTNMLKICGFLQS